MARRQSELTVATNVEALCSYAKTVVVKLPDISNIAVFEIAEVAPQRL